MRCGGSHGKKPCEHADSPRECEKCGRNNHTIAVCFAKMAKRSLMPALGLEDAEKNALDLKRCPETTHQAKSPRSPLKRATDKMIDAPQTQIASQ